MKLQLLILCFYAHLYVASALSSDGLTLLSLLKHWTFVPPSINSSWIVSDSTPCSWVGVKCNHDSQVISLNLTASGVTGKLGPEIGNLNHLQTIVLLTNNFSGVIPPQLGNCSLLRYIEVSDNYFSGRISYALKKLQNLRYLSLSSNMLTGEIPESLFQIPQLEEVYLYNNGVSGPIPTNIGNMSELSKLYLSSNQLSGNIPSSIGNCSKLEALVLNNNGLNGNLPRSLNNLKNLVYLDVKNNSLGGIIPLGSGSCEKLFILDLSLNVFSGGIPSGLGNCSSLAEFAAVKCNLVGGIPSSLGSLSELSILRLPDNHLSGKIPPEIGNCKSLKKLHFYSNQLEGEIPNELGRLNKLQDLELYFNHLQGKIPLSIWKVQSLQNILVHNNSLSGTLPLEVTELKHLKNISLSDNQFSGVIPQSLGINSSLVKLDLMNNEFTGNIPPNLCFGKQLRVFNLGLNQLQGGIPHDVGRCATLRRLTLNENNLTGSLPEFESNQNLIYMDISKNNISGAIPSSLGKCTNLTALILSMNIITGLIPSEVGNLVNLQFLNLAHNNLEGPLPQLLSYCTKMERFDVGFNFINGSLPSSLRNWTGITTLILRENRFSGVIPSFLSEFDQLLDLQLGGNLFGGKIPASIGAMQNLLYGLNLSANGFAGKVPLEIRKLKKLQVLDVSLNNLTGSIDVLGELSSLIDVNISNNSFVGPVPERLVQYLNFSPSSFMGNPGLCVRCYGLSCSKPRPSYLKPCDSEATDHKGISKFVILVIELGSSTLVALLLVKLIHLRLSRQRSEENMIAYSEEEGQFHKKKKKKKRRAEGQWPSSAFGEVMKATENLNDRYIVGRGAHGIVYKAELDVGVVAVKKLVFPGMKRKRLRMLKEIEIMKNLKHRQVASCLGYWIEQEHCLIFFKYMENGSLHDVLHENDAPPSLEWTVRYKIAVGVAQGLAYLHHGCHPPILHRDINPKNILLHSDMEPCITDFGIAIALDQSSTRRHLRSTYHIGTLGYMAPEIAYAAVLSCELDVYSYGVVLLELITRKKVLDSSFEEEETTLVGWFRSVWREARGIEEIVDSSLVGELSDLNVKVQVTKVLLVALMCTEKDPGKRSKMEDVIKIYEAPRIQGISVECGTFHLGKALAAAAHSIYMQLELLFDARTKSVLHTKMADKHHFVKRVKHDNDVRSIDKERNSEHVTNTSKSIQQNFSGSGAHDRGKQVLIAEDYSHTGSELHRNMASSSTPPPTPYISFPLLHYVLHVQNPSQNLQWSVRYKIAVGIARELAYLLRCHPPTVRQGLNARNIVLDSNMEPTLHQPVFMPIYPSSSPAENGHRMVEADASDVHDYGVILLELLTKEKVSGSDLRYKLTFMEQVRSVWCKTGDLEKIVDSSLARELSDLTVMAQVSKVFSVALLCTEEDPRKRPTMRRVIELL